MNRRRFLAASTAITTAVLAGCGNPDDGGDGYSLEESTQENVRRNPESPGDSR